MNSKSKKAMAFTFLALFIAFLMVSFSSFILSDNIYTQSEVYEESRIVAVDNELEYFREVYVRSAVSFSLYNVVDSLINFSAQNPSEYETLNQNYTKLNELIFEGLVNGSFNGISQDALINKTLVAFLETYVANFNDNHFANFTYELDHALLYEKKPYFLSLQLGITYNVTNVSTLGDLSSWGFNDVIEVSIPISGFDDPLFLMYEDEAIPVTPVESVRSTTNWSLELFNESLRDFHSTAYVDNTFKYAIGESFIDRMLNKSISSYDRVIGFWSFDYDVLEEEVYDTSAFDSQAEHFGNTRFLLRFDGEPLNDSSDYFVTLTPSPHLNCTQTAVYRTGCKYNGTTDHLNVSDLQSLEESLNSSFSMSIWFRAINSNPTDWSTLFKTSNGPGRTTFGVDIHSDDSTFSPGMLTLTLRDRLSNEIVIAYDSNTSLTNWVNLIINAKNVSTGDIDLILNGEKLEASLKVTQNPRAFSFFDHPLTFGGSNNDGKIERYFNGSIDEVAFYSKVLTPVEIARIYSSRQGVFIDYDEGLYDEMVYFDGIDDNLSIEYLNEFDTDNYTVEFWFSTDARPDDRESQQIIVIR